MNTNTLTVKDLCKTYVINKRQNNVLRNINMEIKQGEMVAVMGPSGSGKSTLLYTVSGMDRLTAGRVDFFGKDISALDSEQMSSLRLNEMGFIFQQMYMLKNLSIYDNIILPAYQSKNGRGKEKRRQINDRAKELMHKLGISEIAEHDINEVSGGQLQRACICRSLINHPKMIFADEPTGALNQQNSKEVMKELNRINAEGTTILLVTHDMKVAAKSDRILYIEDGSIKGEYAFGKYKGQEEDREREKKLSVWLMEMGF
ncbi:MAG: ABC transporter ATP-binding protein [Eubacterium sp.]|nr:ABC transporter ATP-binding protein [Eubacterium sp.]